MWQRDAAPGLIHPVVAARAVPVRPTQLVTQRPTIGRSETYGMIVPSLLFLGFAAVAALVFNLGGASWWRRLVLLAVNLAFLASFSHDPLAFLPFAGFLALGFAAQRVTRRGAVPRLFVALLGAALIMFFWLKRYSFIPSSSFLPFPYVLVGLSYVFFRVLHLIIDSHQGAIERPVGVLSYLNYTLNFTCLTSGPIQRYQDYHRMETERLPLDFVVAGEALERIVVGYFKVTVVSMLLFLAQHHAIDSLNSAHAPGVAGTMATMLAGRVWLGVLVAAIYPAYLYFNFSGYVDVVIGVARFFRIVLPENFDRPFSSENFLAFWSRWHMTLSGWLKTYVFNPLMLAGVARVTAPALAPYIAVGAFFVTFFLVGLWHGQTSEFLFFGFLQGGGVAVNKLYQVLLQQRLGRKGYRTLAEHSLYHACCRGLTFTWFAFTLFWFWSSWHQMASFVHDAGPLALVLAWVTIVAASTVILAAMEALRAAALRVTWNEVTIVRSRYVRVACNTALLVVITVLVTVLDAPAPDIVYKTF